MWQGLVHAQVMRPEVQKLVDSLNTWVLTNVQAGTLDTAELAAFNKYIRQVQDSLDRQVVNSSVAIGDSSALIHKSVMAGSVLSVPTGVYWHMLKAYVKSDQDGYRVVAASLKWKDRYLPGEKIIAPSFSSEASLLSGELSAMFYDFDILEYPLPK